MSRERRGPGAIVRLLQALIPQAHRDELVGDLLEERDRRLRTGRANQLWYGRQLLLAVIHAVVSPLLRPRRLATAAGVWANDLRMAARALRCRPGVTLLTVATLAIGIGATTAMFTLSHAILIRPLPFADPDRLVRLGERSLDVAPDQVWSISEANFLDLEGATTTLEGIAAYRLRPFNLAAAGPPVRVMGQAVTHDFMALLGQAPLLGRNFLPDDDREGAEAVVVISHALWRDAFDRDPAALGATVVLDGISHRIVGVAPADFAFPGDPLLWVPFAWSTEERTNRRGRSIEGIGRLRPGVGLDAALAELQNHYAALATVHPENANRSVGGRPLRTWIVGSTAPRRLLLLSGAAVLVLLIACANVANLLLASGETRQRELAVRAALGAGRGRITRLLVAESALSALLGGGVGIGLAHLALRISASHLTWLPRTGGVHLDGTVTAFALGLALATGLIAGGAPAVRMGGRDLLGAMSRTPSGARGSNRRARRALVVAEVALSLVLLVGAGLLTRSVRLLGDVDLGVDPVDVVTFSLSPPSATYPEADDFLAFYDRAIEELAALPGVEAVGGQNRPILSGGGNAGMSVGPGDQDYEHLVETREVTGRLFMALGMRLEEGRDLEPADRNGEPVVVVNATFVAGVLGGEAAIGRSLRVDHSDREFRIVGVVNDVRDFGPDAPAPPTAYFAYGNGPWRSWPNLVLAVRVHDGATSVPLMRERLAGLDATVPMANVSTLEEIATDRLGSQRRSATYLLTVFSVLAMALASGGVYAVMSYTVSERTHDLGLHQALGATSGDIQRMVVRQGLAQGLLGVILGLFGSFLAGGLLSGLLFEVGPADPSTLMMSAALLLAVCVGACVIPARRAAALEPTVALRAG